MTSTPPTRLDKRSAPADGYVSQATEKEQEADANAVAAWLLDCRNYIDEKTAYAAGAAEDRERDAANQSAVEAANRLLIPDAAPITCEQGLVCWNGIKFLTLQAAVAHVRLIAEAAAGRATSTRCSQSASRPSAS